MAKFCGRCGSKIDDATGLCPNCDADELNKQTENPEVVEPPKQEQDTAPESKKLLSKKEAKKQRKADKKAAKKAKKKEKWACMTFGQRLRRIILRLVLWLIIAIIITVGVIGGLSHFNIIDIPLVTAYREGKLLEVINERNIIIEETSIVMTSDTEGTTTIIVEMPNYEVLFREAAATANPDRYLFRALVLKRYEVKKFEATAYVTVKNGKTTVHTDDTVHRLVEEALINAINGLSEVG